MPDLFAQRLPLGEAPGVRLLVAQASNNLDFSNNLLAQLYPKLRTRFSLSGKNPGFSANTFSTSQIIDEVKKVKLPDHKGFSDSNQVAKKMDKVELRGCFKSPRHLVVHLNYKLQIKREMKNCLRKLIPLSDIDFIKFEKCQIMS